MSWSTRRKLLSLLGAVLIAGAAVFYFSYPLLKENPICTDGKQNGDEVGVDCGGVCTNLCPNQIRPASIIWQRAFQVAPGIYDLLGYIENQNSDAGVPNLLYRFKIYDDKNVLIAERDGKTYLGPNQKSAIFEGQVRTGERIPKRIFLEFEDGYNWIKTDARFGKILLSVKDKNLINSSTTPELKATIRNDSLVDLKNIEVATILRNSEDNAIAVSSTVIESLPKQSSGDVFFTWLSPFTETVSTIEIVPRVNPFEIKF